MGLFFKISCKSNTLSNSSELIDENSGGPRGMRLRKRHHKKG
jgi:hypothetical protein